MRVGDALPQRERLIEAEVSKEKQGNERNSKEKNIRSFVQMGMHLQPPSNLLLQRHIDPQKANADRIRYIVVSQGVTTPLWWHPSPFGFAALVTV